jgi:mannan endo-1,4-beta-mannosidase
MPTLIDDGRGSYSYNDTTSPVVKHILPGGFAHEKFKNELLKFVEFTEKISDIPIIFRPFHEHNRSWFWWGKNHCTVQEYKSLWRFTVDFLRSHNAHNILYAYSPNYVTWDYLERYPGDQYVDILGVDMYFRNPLFDLWEHGATPQLEWKHDIVWLMREAEKRDKIPAITEFGQEGSWYERFWTDYMGWPIERAGVAQITGHHALPRYGIAYIMLWRNDIRDPKHFYGPVPGHMNNYNFHQLRSKKIFKGLGE